MIVNFPFIMLSVFLMFTGFSYFHLPANSQQHGQQSD